MIAVLNIIHLSKDNFPPGIIQDESVKREQNIKAQAVEHKFTYGIWDGIKDVLPHTGISKSHKQIVQHAKDNWLTMCFIAEDDFKLMPGGWRYFTENIPDDFDVYLAGVSGGNVNEETKEVTMWSGMFLYCVHSRFYDVFLSADEGKNIDRWLSTNALDEIENKLGRKPVYKVCYPMAAITNDGVSFKSGAHVEHGKYFKPYQVLR